jgi:hypothetical protein
MPGHAWRARPAAAYMTQTVLECNKMVERGQNFHAAKEQSLPSPTQSSGDERGRPVIGGVLRARLRPEWMPARHRRAPPTATLQAHKLACGYLPMTAPSRRLRRVHWGATVSASD